jgi:hypothetical protein
VRISATGEISGEVTIIDPAGTVVLDDTFPDASRNRDTGYDEILTDPGSYNVTVTVTEAPGLMGRKETEGAISVPNPERAQILIEVRDSENEPRTVDISTRKHTDNDEFG